MKMLRMKYAICFLCATGCMLFCGQQGVYSQTVVPNAGMEEWNNIIIYEEPKNWSTPNAVVSALGIKLVEKTTDAAGGMYAAKLKAAYLAAFNLTAPGAMSTGTLDISDPLNPTFRGGFKLNDPNAVAVIGQYKYTPVGNDSCLVFAIKTRWNASLNRRDTIAIASFVGAAAANYTPFTAPFFVLIPGAVADSANIIVSTAANVLTAQAGSTLYIDNIDFTNSIGLPDLVSMDARVFPTLANEQVHIQLSQPVADYHMRILDGKGRIVSQFWGKEEEIKIDVWQWAAGLYFFYCTDGDGRIVALGRFYVAP